jgi:hypothetical protein
MMPIEEEARAEQRLLLSALRAGVPDAEAKHQHESDRRCKTCQMVPTYLAHRGKTL